MKQPFLKTHFLLLAITAAAVSGLFLTGGSFHSRVNTVSVNGTPLVLEYARTEAEREQGLSDRASLPSNHGMLFVFPRADRYAFWMPRMHFPLDMLWLREGRVVEIHEQVPAPKQGETPVTITPIEAADRVLEINAGMAERYQLKVGSEIPGLP